MPWSARTFAQAEVWMERTFRQLSCGGPKTRCGFLRTHCCHMPGTSIYGAASTDDAVKLLEQWETIAERGKGPARAAGCRLQRAVLASSSDWPEVLRAFEEFQQQGGAQKVAEKLFTEWRDRTANECAYGGEQKATPGRFVGQSAALKRGGRRRRTSRPCLIIWTFGANAFKRTPHSSKSNGAPWRC